MSASSNSRRRSLRRAMMQAVTPADISEIMKLQVFLARKGDPMAVREVLDRVIGKPGSVLDIIHSPHDGEPGMASFMPGEADTEARTMDSLTAPPPRTLPLFDDIETPLQTKEQNDEHGRRA